MFWVCPEVSPSWTWPAYPHRVASRWHQVSAPPKVAHFSCLYAHSVTTQNSREGWGRGSHGRYYRPTHLPLLDCLGPKILELLHLGQQLWCGLPAFFQERHMASHQNTSYGMNTRLVWLCIATRVGSQTILNGSATGNRNANIFTHRTESVCTSLFFYFLFFFLSIHCFYFFPFSFPLSISLIAPLFPSLPPSISPPCFLSLPSLKSLSHLSPPRLPLLRWIIFGLPG